MKAGNRRQASAKAGRAPHAAAWKHRMRRLGLCLTGLSGAVLMGWLANQALSVHTWQVEGADPFLRRAISRELTAMQPLDFLHAQPGRLRHILLDTLPDLADVHITRHLAGRLHITATARRPVAIWQQGNTLRLIDAQGTAFVSRRKGARWDLPIVRSDRRNLAAAGRLLAQLRRTDNARFADLSECVFLAPKTWGLYFSHGRRWLLPADKTAAQRMRILLAMLHRPRWKGRAWRVDARMDTKWFFRQTSPQGGTI